MTATPADLGRLAADGPAHRYRPVVLASATRSGSTLLQRVLNTHPELTIWGEHMGILSHLRSVRDDIVTFERNIDRGFEHRDHLIGPLNDVDQLSEHINPFSSTTVVDALARMTVDLFTSTLPADVRWGFKEVRYDGDDLEFVSAMFPQAHFVLLAREPRDQISSYVRAPWRQKPNLATDAGRARLRAMAKRVADNWTKQYASLREFAARHPEQITVFRFDEIQSAETAIPALFERIGMVPPPRERIQVVLDKKSGSSDATSAWSPSDLAVLADVLDEVDYDEEHAATRAHFLG